MYELIVDPSLPQLTDTPNAKASSAPLNHFVMIYDYATAMASPVNPNIVLPTSITQNCLSYVPYQTTNYPIVLISVNVNSPILMPMLSMSIPPSTGMKQPG